MADHKTPHPKPVAVHADEKPKGQVYDPRLDPRNAGIAIEPRKPDAVNDPKLKGDPKKIVEARNKEHADRKKHYEDRRAQRGKAGDTREPKYRDDAPFAPSAPPPMPRDEAIATHPHHATFSASDPDVELGKGAKKGEQGTAPIFAHPYGSEPRRSDFVEPPKVKAEK